MRGLAVLGVGAVVVLLAGCDDDSEADDRFVADADAICTEVAEGELAAFAASPGPELSVEYLERVHEQRAEALERFAALEVSDEAEPAFNDYIAKLEQSNQAIDDAVTAVKAERPEDLAAARVRAREVRLEANEIGAEIGFVTCAGVLSADHQEAITETLELTIDPEAARELCARRSTEAFIAARFASVAACERAQSADTGVETVAINELQGVEGVSAHVLVELGSANGDGVEYEASLAYEDETWKLNSIAPTAPAG